MSKYLRFIISSVAILFISSVSAQQKYTFTGYIKDSLTGESLIGANIQIKPINKGVTSNQYGYFSITLPEGSYLGVCTNVGYKTTLFNIELDKDIVKNILINSASSAMQDIVVTGRKRDNNVKTAQLGKVDVSMSTAKALPAFLGEVDIMKTLQLLPGVRNAGEGNSGFYVRGGGADQNLIILDDAVVFNPGHLFGFFSVFSSDAIKNVTLIKGDMPAQYGGRLSSVIDITMKEGNMNKMQVDAGIGLISSRLSVQGPIVKNKMSFIISGRRTYIDVLTKPALDKSEKFKGTGYYFYDLNAKINYIISPKDRLYLSGYFGRDKFTFNNTEQAFSTTIPWGNSTASLRWNHVFNKKLFMNTSLVYNDYNFEFNGAQQNFNINLKSGITDWNLKTDFDYYVSPEHKLKFGGLYTYHTFYPNLLSGNQDTVKFQPNVASIKYANEFALYLQDDWDLFKKFKVSYGLRFTSFEQVGPYKKYTTDANGNRTDSTVYGSGQSVKTYSALEPRFAVRYEIKDNQSVKFGITNNMQYIHLVSNSGSTLPTDLWVPSTLNVKPQISWQYSAGYFRNFKEGMYETSLECYYKTMDNQIEYKNGYTPNTLKDPEESFVFGKGWSYGTELFINKTKGRFTGWFGYTLSWTFRKFKDLNDGNEYPSKYDRRHDLSIVGMYDVNKKWRLSAVFIYGTGAAFSAPERLYTVGGVLTQQFSKINEYRMDPYHRLDLAATYTPKHNEHKKVKDYWVFSIYNVYNHYNPYFLYLNTTGSLANNNLQLQYKQVSLFPIIPSVAWNVKF